MERIVVGVDGSPASVDALCFAIDEARLRGARLVVVYAYRFPVLTMLPLAPKPPTPEELAEGADALLARALADAGDPQDVNVERLAIEGHPAEVLVDVAAGATLLVVAARGVGGFRGSLLGSVSQQCAQHAPCPVTIVRRAQVEHP